jgi:hypothetical protein
MNETTVREAIVSPLLKRLGFDYFGADGKILTEKPLRYERAFLGRKNAKKDPPLAGRADYICEVSSYGRWVVEVKRPSEELSQDVVEQAHTYANHPEVAASYFLVTNGRSFRLYETAKLERAALAWDFEDEDDNLLRLFNTLSPAAFRKRAAITLIDPGKPLGKGLPSRLRIIGGEITYEEHTASLPLLQAGNVAGLVLPVTGGYVARSEDKRIVGHVTVAKSIAFLQDLKSLTGASDEYDFYSATEYIADEPEHPSIFQNVFEHHVAAGQLMRIAGLPPFQIPFPISSTSSTEAVGFVRDDKFVGTMSLTYEFDFSRIPLQMRMMLRPQLGDIPDRAHMTGAGRFEISLQPDIWRPMA